jgi:hypothetical protein
MPGLLATYDRMVDAQPASAEELEKIATISKYAELSDELLAEKYGNDYTAADVEELAGLLIEHDAEVFEKEAELEEMEKEAAVAELYEAGAIMARGFHAELEALRNS